MANEVTVASNAGFFGTLVAGMEMAIGDRFALRGLVPLAGLGSSVKVPVFDDTDAAVTESEAAAADNVNYTDSSITLSPGRYSLVRNISDLYAMAGGPGADINDPQVVMSLVNSAELAFNADLCALFDNLSTVKGTSGATLTVDTIYEAIAALEIAGVMPGDQVVCVLHPKQLNDFRDDLRGEAGVLMWQDASSEMMARKGPGYAGRWNNVDFYSSSAVATDGTDYFGALFKIGCFKYASLDPQILIAQNPSRQITVVGDVIFIEGEGNAVNGTNQVVVNMYYSIGEVQDSAGVAIRSID